METARNIVLQIKLSAKNVFLAVAAVFILWRPAVLGSETMKMTSYYPAPYGGYVNLLTTGNTYLAKSGGTVYWGQYYSNLSTDQGGSIELRGSGTGATPFIDFTHNGTSSTDYDNRLILGSDNRLNVARNLGVSGYMYVGSRIGVLTDTAYAYSSSYGYYGLIVNQNYDTNDGIAVYNGSAVTVISNDSSYEGNVGTISPHSMNIISGGQVGIKLQYVSTTLPPTVTVNGDLVVKKNIYMRYASNLTQAQPSDDMARIYNLCVKKYYNPFTATACPSGYTLIGYLPDYWNSYYWQSEGDSSYIYRRKALEGMYGYITCCAMYVPTVTQ